MGGGGEGEQLIRGERKFFTRVKKAVEGGEKREK